MVVEVTFKGNRREFFDWPFPEPPAEKTPVIVAVERGEDFGRVHATGDLARRRKAGTTHGLATRDPLRKILRAASADDITHAAQLRADEYNVRVRAIEKVRALGLDMKVSDTEWQWDRKRLTIYFTSEQRVDFRQLVRQLEGLFGTRVHMWHIGVRDEAKRVDGIGRCGRQLCSASWLPELVPVKSSVAKDQHLSTLNPVQISGACGRLMCCLRYEHEFYVAQRKRFPKEGRVLRTSAGEEKVLSLDIFRETVTVRAVAGEVRVIPLAQLRADLQGEQPGWASRTGAAGTALEADSLDADASDAGAPDAPDAPDAPGDDTQDRSGAGDVSFGELASDAAARGLTARAPLPAPPASLPATKPHGTAPQPAGPDAGRRRRRGRRGGRRGRGGPPHHEQPPSPPRNNEPNA